MAISTISPAAADSFDEFRAVYEQCARMVEEAMSEEMLGSTHDVVEGRINAQGQKVMRLVLQGHFNTRAKKEVRREEVIGKDGLVRDDLKEDCKRPLMSLFGEVVVTRVGYGKYGGQYLYPLDAELNLPIRKYSGLLQRKVVEEIVNISYDQAVSSVERATAGTVPKRQAEQIVVEIAQDFESFNKTRHANASENTEDLLILTTDGKGVVMRPEALREATKKAAAKESHKLTTRLSAGEKRNRKRMATVAAVYSIKEHIRTAETIMKVQDKPKQAAPKPQNKRVWASLAREPGIVVDEMFQEALRRDPERKRQWATLIDGSLSQLQNVQDCIKRYNLAGTIVILDFIHVLEYLWRAAFCLHAKGTKAAEEWVSKQALSILNGKSSAVAAGMRRSATNRKLSAKARKPIDQCADYLHRFKDMLRYDTFLALGLPIATGIIEGACRYLVADRMDKTGARWGLSGGESVLKLRALDTNGELDAYWQHHNSQAFQRNHAALYSGNTIQFLRQAA
jgi:hypothetical protein